MNNLKNHDLPTTSTTARRMTYYEAHKNQIIVIEHDYCSDAIDRYSDEIREHIDKIYKHQHKDKTTPNAKMIFVTLDSIYDDLDELDELNGDWFESGISGGDDFYYQIANSTYIINDKITRLLHLIKWYEPTPSNELTYDSLIEITYLLDGINAFNDLWFDIVSNGMFSEILSNTN